MKHSVGPTDVEQQIADLRPLLARALHSALPELSLVDCAAMANKVLDDAEQGELDLVRAARTFLDGVLASAAQVH
jgi:hypothetical protein